jgi:excisionase family DNA binding protein
MGLHDLVESRKTAMKVSEVAALLNVSQRLVYQLVEIGEVPYFRVGSAVRFEPKALSVWLHEKMNKCKNRRAVKAIEPNPQTGAPIKLNFTAEWCLVLTGKRWRG